MSVKSGFTRIKTLQDFYSFNETRTQIGSDVIYFCIMKQKYFKFEKDDVIIAWNVEGDIKYLINELPANLKINSFSLSDNLEKYPDLPDLSNTHGEEVEAESLFNILENSPEQMEITVIAKPTETGANISIGIPPNQQVLSEETQLRILTSGIGLIIKAKRTDKKDFELIEMVIEQLKDEFKSIDSFHDAEYLDKRK